MVDSRNPQNVRDALRENTKLVWLETPTNPLLRVADIQGIFVKFRLKITFDRNFYFGS